MKKEPDVSRRNFLKGTVMGAGALTAGFGAGLLTPVTAQGAMLPYPFTKPGGSFPLLDVDDVTRYAYDGYFAGG
jgi:anaerobic selenocysteine-containing dehydrogenase